MGKRKLAALVAVVWVALGTSAAQATIIEYDATYVGGTQWRYDYFVANNTLPGPIGWFSLSFEQSLYLDLANAVAPPGWDPLVQQPDPALPDAGIFDLYTESSAIPTGSSTQGFSIGFQWLGAGDPGGQRFDVIDTDPGAPIETGFTQRRAPADVPEPGTALLLGTALALFGVFGRRRRTCR